jgi:hypothetical protein
MTHCEQSTRLQDYLDGDLPLDERLRVEAHVAVCAACARDLALYARVFSALEREPLLAPAPGFSDRVLHRLGPELRAPVWTRAFGIAYAAGLLVSIGALAGAALLPGPRAFVRDLLGTAIGAVSDLFVFVLKSLNDAALRLVDVVVAFASAFGVLGPLVRALLAPLANPVVLSVSLAALAVSVATLWWMRPREGRKGVSHGDR